MSDYGSYSSKGSPTFAAFVPAYAAPLRRSSAVSSTTSIREAAPAPHATEPRVSLNARILHLFRASHRLFAPPQPVTPSPAPSLLHDVIANKHLSPLSLHDFQVRTRLRPPRARAHTLQEHLRTARSLENLEFIICQFSHPVGVKLTEQGWPRTRRNGRHTRRTRGRRSCCPFRTSTRIRSSHLVVQSICRTISSAPCVEVSLPSLWTALTSCR